MDDLESLSLALPDGTKVSALLRVPEDARALYVFAHGAGAGMQHAGMSTLADALAAAKCCHIALSVSVHGAGLQAGGLAGRGTCCRAGSRRRGPPAAASPAALRRRQVVRRPHDVPGPGHLPTRRRAWPRFRRVPAAPAGAPGVERARHLADVTVPMLFLQGTRDKLAEFHLLKSVVETLGSRATLHVVDDADHSLHVRASSGRTDAEVMLELARTMSAWFFAEGEFVPVT
ncbi:alpha/beta family hydrolase [Burkholderia sp. JPY481]